MTTIMLTILRCPDGAPPETRQLNGGEITLGRGRDCSWALFDPDQQLSRRHCTIEFERGGWQVIDLSRNGTFLNNDTNALGVNVSRTLNDGDRLRLGSYEIEVRVTAAVASRSDNLTNWSVNARAPSAGAPDQTYSPPYSDSLDPFASPSPAGSGFSLPTPGQSAQDYDPLFDGPQPSIPNPSRTTGFIPAASAHPGHSPFMTEPSIHEGNYKTGYEASLPTQADHMPVLQDAFAPPRPASSVLPDDWDLDLTSPLPPPPSEPSVGLPGMASAPPISPPPAAPLIAVAGIPSTPHAQDDSLLAAFLRGAEMEQAPPPTDPATTMTALGAAFRALVAGLRQALIARATIKSEFRIEQTMIRARGNNPLKFSADDDDALAGLLGVGRRAEMTPAAAITDAIRDMRLHELAVMTAMQVGVRELLARFDPAAIRNSAENGARSAVPTLRKARAWDAFMHLHHDVSLALQDDFDSVFGKAFALAYEEALNEAKKNEG